MEAHGCLCAAWDLRKIEFKDCFVHGVRLENGASVGCNAVTHVRTQRVDAILGLRG